MKKLAISVPILLSLLILLGCNTIGTYGRYTIYTYESRQINDYWTDDLTIESDRLILHGYTLDGGKAYSDDQIIDIDDIYAIWDGREKIFPSGYQPVDTGINYWWDEFTGKRAVRFVFTGELRAIFYLFILGLFFISASQVGMMFWKNNIKPWFWRRVETSKYKQVLQDKIVVPDDAQGIIACRDWNMRQGLLISANQGLIWETTDVVADKCPQKGNKCGIYAYRLGTNTTRVWGKVSGLVALSGHCVGHNGGLIRAEKCRILMLFCLYPSQAKKLSSLYGVPVMMTLDKKADLTQWLITKDGIKWLQHNADLLDDHEIANAINAIVKKEGF